MALTRRGFFARLFVLAGAVTCAPAAVSALGKVTIPPEMITTRVSWDVSRLNPAGPLTFKGIPIVWDADMPRNQVFLMPRPNGIMTGISDGA